MTAGVVALFSPYVAAVPRARALWRIGASVWDCSSVAGPGPRHARVPDQAPVNDQAVRKSPVVPVAYSSTSTLKVPTSRLIPASSALLVRVVRLARDGP